MTTIRSPVEWTAQMLGQAVGHVGAMARSLAGDQPDVEVAPPTVRRIRLADLKDALRRGFDDFGACRTDVMFLCLIYPLVGLLLIRYAAHLEMLPLVFPLVSGFALIGPVIGVLLYEMSRRREQGRDVSWADAFGVLRSPALGAILVLGSVLLMIFALWLLAAQAIYGETLGPEPPASLAGFVSDVLTTPAGWTMTVLGIGVGFLCAVGVLLLGVVSFPLLLDRHVGLGVAIETSVRAVVVNPVPMAAWGVIVAGSLALGSLPALLGLVVVIPVLGHATWHLYRKVVAPPPAPGIDSGV